MEERKDKREERVEDLQVRDDEARDIAGGKKDVDRKKHRRSRAGTKPIIHRSDAN
jgi:hypothetical protein